MTRKLHRLSHLRCSIIVAMRRLYKYKHGPNRADTVTPQWALTIFHSINNTGSEWCATQCCTPCWTNIIFENCFLPIPLLNFLPLLFVHAYEEELVRECKIFKKYHINELSIFWHWLLMHRDYYLQRRSEVPVILFSASLNFHVNWHTNCYHEHITE